MFKRFVAFMAAALLAQLVLPTGSQAQFHEFSRIEFGGSIGTFRISLDRFEDFYESRWTTPLGASIAYAFSPSMHLAIHGKTFSKRVSRQGLEDLEIIQTWYGVGIRRLTNSLSGKSRTALGFGLAFFVIDESEGGNLLTDLNTGPTSSEPKGFFINFRLDRFVSRTMMASLEIELTSAAVGDGFGLESQSFGGIFIGAGLNFGLF